MNRAQLPAGRLVEPVVVGSVILLRFEGGHESGRLGLMEVDVSVFQKERGSWRTLLNASFRRTSLLLWYSW